MAVQTQTSNVQEVTDSAVENVFQAEPQEPTLTDRYMVYVDEAIKEGSKPNDMSLILSAVFEDLNAIQTGENGEPKISDDMFPVVAAILEKLDTVELPGANNSMISFKDFVQDSKFSQLKDIYNIYAANKDLINNNNDLKAEDIVATAYAADLNNELTQRFTKAEENSNYKAKLDSLKTNLDSSTEKQVIKAVSFGVDFSMANQVTQAFVLKEISKNLGMDEKALDGLSLEQKTRVIHTNSRILSLDFIGSTDELEQEVKSIEKEIDEIKDEGVKSILKQRLAIKEADAREKLKDPDKVIRLNTTPLEDAT